MSNHQHLNEAYQYVNVEISFFYALRLSVFRFSPLSIYPSRSPLLSTMGKLLVVIVIEIIDA